MIAMPRTRETSTIRKSLGLSVIMVAAARTMVSTDDTNYISPTCIVENTFSRSLVTRLVMSPVLCPLK